MNTRLVIKLSAVAVALLVNGLILGGAAYVVNSQSHDKPENSNTECTAVKLVHIRV